MELNTLWVNLDTKAKAVFFLSLDSSLLQRLSTWSAVKQIPGPFQNHLPSQGFWAGAWESEFLQMLGNPKLL